MPALRARPTTEGGEECCSSVEDVWLCRKVARDFVNDPRQLDSAPVTLTSNWQQAGV